MKSIAAIIFIGVIATAVGYAAEDLGANIRNKTVINETAPQTRYKPYPWSPRPPLVPPKPVKTGTAKRLRWPPSREPVITEGASFFPSMDVVTKSDRSREMTTPADVNQFRERW